jgi:fluoroacetyl-CoA thioesterase
MDLTTLIALGAQASRQVLVTSELTVAHAYQGLPEVYASPQMIMLMEMACADVIAALLPAGWVSVGTYVDVKHLAATPVGMTVTASAKVIEVSARSVRFACSAHDGLDLIGEGFHVRAPVALDRFVEGVARKVAKFGERT